MVQVQFGNPVDDARFRLASDLPSEYERRTNGQTKTNNDYDYNNNNNNNNNDSHEVRRSTSRSSSRASSLERRQQHSTSQVQSNSYVPQSTYVREPTGSGASAGLHYRPMSSNSNNNNFVTSGGVRINVYTEPKSVARNSPARLSDEIEVTYGNKHRQSFSLGLGPMDSPSATENNSAFGGGPRHVYWGGDSNGTRTHPQQQQQQRQQSFQRDTVDSSGSISLGGLDLDHRPGSGMSTTSSSAGPRSFIGDNDGGGGGGRARGESPEPTSFLSSMNARKPPLLPRTNSNSAVRAQSPHSRVRNENSYEIPITLHNDTSSNKFAHASGTSPALALSPEERNSAAEKYRRQISGTTPAMNFSPDYARNSISSSKYHSTNSDADTESLFNINNSNDRSPTSTTRFRDDITLPGTQRHALGHVDVPLHIAGLSAIPTSRSSPTPSMMSGSALSDKDRKLAYSGYGATRVQHAEEDYERRSPKRTLPTRNDALVRELKSKVDTIGERLPSRNGSYAINTEMLERRPFSARKRFQPDYYMRAIPAYDDDGHPIPEWRRQFIAKQLAGYVKKEFEYDEDLEDENYFLNKIDLLLSDPEWKRKIGLVNANTNRQSSGAESYYGNISSGGGGGGGGSLYSSSARATTPDRMSTFLD